MRSVCSSAPLTRAPTSGRRRYAVATAVIVLLAAPACSGEGGQADSAPTTEAPTSQEQADTSADPSDQDPDDTEAGGPDADLLIENADTTWDVELASDALVLDERVADGLIEHDGDVFVFEADAFDENQVDTGTVMVVPGVGMGRVTEVETDDGRVSVTTEPTDLSEVIENGTMAWETPLDMASGFMPSAASGGIEAQPASLRQRGAKPLRDGEVRMAGLSLIDDDGRHHAVPTALNQAGVLEWTFEGDGNEYKFRLAPSTSRIDIKVQVTREVAGENTLAYTADGTLETVTTSGSAEFESGSLKSLDIEQKDLAGRMDLSIAAAGSGYADIDFELPGLMFKYIVMVGPVPVTIGITTKIIGSIEVPAEGSATAEAGFTYSGSTGFTYQGSSVESTGKLAGLTMNPDPADSAAMIGQAVDAQFGVAFPRFQISIFDQLLVPYIHTGFTIGSNLSWGPVCKRAYVRTNVDAGYDFKILGTNLYSKKKPLFKQERRADQDGCPELPPEE